MKYVLSLPALCVAMGFVIAYSDCAAMQNPEHTSSPAAVVANTVSKPSAPAATFAVGTLAENEGDDGIEGCRTSLTRVGAVSSGKDTFRQTGDAGGLIRINGVLIHVAEVHSEDRENGKGEPVGSTTVFEDTSHTTRIIATLKFGARNESADSTELTGTLTITYKGVTQTLRVEGGSAC